MTGRQRKVNKTNLGFIVAIVHRATNSGEPGPTVDELKAENPGYEAVIDALQSMGVQFAGSSDPGPLPKARI